MLRMNHLLMALILGLTTFAAIGVEGVSEVEAAVDHAVEEAHAPAGGGGLLQPDAWGALWNLALFLLLFFVLARFVWPHILNALNAREEKIRSDIAGAEAANRQAQQTLADYQRQLSESHAEARKLVEQARVDAEAVRQRIVAETESEAARLRKRAAEEIEQAKNAATQELYARASELSVAVAEKILKRQITEADTQRLIDQSLAELDSVAGRKAS